MIVGRQIRAARALLDMSQEQLAEATGLTPQAIRKIENGDVQPREGTIADVTRAFNERGLEFIDNHGVRFRPQSVEVLEGPDGFSRFYDLVYEHLNKHGGNVCVSGVDEKLFSRYHLDVDKHKTRMAELLKRRNDISMRILVEEGDFNFAASSYASYRWQLKESFSPTSFYVVGDRLALISFSHEPAPLVIVIKSAPFAEAYRQSFNVVWLTSREPPALREEK